ncbi:F-box/FBD/LRR-repeat protein At1g13570-like [Bidens hawaiensis]|uniref:F-box/FBD/LRR-repeat protein At1g13570-like n=1 Tax=Bidens hawaiensis TaxID=980011 RepID=UPI00404B85FA
MEGRHKTSKFALQDFISNMPDIVITNILDRLPLQEAVRTGVSSGNWRLKWTMLSQLVIEGKFFEYLRNTKGKHNVLKIISIVLLQLKGTITKFVLSVDYLLHAEDEDISHWILLLSRKGIKDLTIKIFVGSPLLMPIHFFSCLELKHLKLYDCCLHPPPSFHGFPNLMSFEWQYGEDNELGDFYSRCLSLEILKLDEVLFQGKVKLVDIAKLENLKLLYLHLCDLDITSSITIFEHLGSLPKLQELRLDF